MNNKDIRFVLIVICLFESEFKMLNSIISDLFNVIRKSKNTYEKFYYTSVTMKNALIAFEDVSNDAILDSFNTIDFEIDLLKLYYKSYKLVSLDNTAACKIIDDACHKLIEEYTKIVQKY